MTKLALTMAEPGALVDERLPTPQMGGMKESFAEVPFLLSMTIQLLLGPLAKAPLYFGTPYASDAPGHDVGAQRRCRADFHVRSGPNHCCTLDPTRQVHSPPSARWTTLLTSNWIRSGAPAIRVPPPHFGALQSIVTYGRNLRYRPAYDN